MPRIRTPTALRTHRALVAHPPVLSARSLDRYASHHGPAHLAVVGDLATLRAWLLTPSTLVALAEAGGGDALARWWAHLGEDDVAATYTRAIDRAPSTWGTRARMTVQRVAMAHSTVSDATIALSARLVDDAAEHPDEGPRHRQRHRYLHSRLLQRARRCGEAELVLRDLVATAEASFGADDVDTRDYASSLGALLLATFQLDAAESWLRRDLEVAERCDGPGSGDAAVARNNLAAWFTQRGDTARALAMYEQSFEALRVSSGDGDPRTLTAASNLADALTRLGRGDDAARVALDVVRRRRRAIGPDHPDTLVSCLVVARAHAAGGSHAAALEEARAVAARATALFGPADEVTLSAGRCLAASLAATGAYAEAAATSLESARAALPSLGARHPWTVAFAVTAARFASPHQRTEVMGLLLDVSASAGRDVAPGLVRAMGSLAMVLVEVERLEDAIPLLEEAVRAWMSARGPLDAETTTTAVNLSIVLERAGRRAEAIRGLEAHLAACPDAAASEVATVASTLEAMRLCAAV